MADREESNPFRVKELWWDTNNSNKSTTKTAGMSDKDFECLIDFVTDYNAQRYSPGTLHLRYSAFLGAANLKERQFQGPEVEWFTHSPPLTYSEVWKLGALGIDFFHDYEKEQWYQKHSYKK